VEVSSLPYVDPARFELASSDPNALTSLAVAIAPENLSLIEKSDDELEDTGIEEKVLPVVEGASMKKMLVGEGASEQQAPLSSRLSSPIFRSISAPGRCCASGWRPTTRVRPSRCA
jgi:hypothetical protein